MAGRGYQHGTYFGAPGPNAFRPVFGVPQGAQGRGRVPGQPVRPGGNVPPYGQQQAIQQRPPAHDPTTTMGYGYQVTTQGLPTTWNQTQPPYAATTNTSTSRGHFPANATTNGVTTALPPVPAVPPQPLGPPPPVPPVPPPPVPPVTPHPVSSGRPISLSAYIPKQPSPDTPLQPMQPLQEPLLSLHNCLLTPAHRETLETLNATRNTLFDATTKASQKVFPRVDASALKSLDGKQCDAAQYQDLAKHLKAFSSASQMPSNSAEKAFRMLQLHLYFDSKHGIELLSREGQVEYATVLKARCEQDGDVAPMFVRTFLDGTWKTKNPASVASSIKRNQHRFIPLDLDSLSIQIKAAQNAADTIRGQHVIFLLGTTGSGKTTATHFLAGSTLEKDKTHGTYAVKQATPGLESFSISDNLDSETLHVSAVELQATASPNRKLYLVDTPGFQDNRSIEVEISTGFGLSAAIQACASVYPVYLMPAAKIDEQRRHFILQAAAESVVPFFKNDLEKMQAHLTICLSRIMSTGVDYPARAVAKFRQLESTLDDSGMYLKGVRTGSFAHLRGR
eukprot:m.179104 g.179104  ORF g.179104 m.179104 type:complete len:564 (-) comp14640_c4_seq8:8288-9979(-)